MFTLKYERDTRWWCVQSCISPSDVSKFVTWRLFFNTHVCIWLMNWNVNEKRQRGSSLLYEGKVNIWRTPCPFNNVYFRDSAQWLFGCRAAACWFVFQANQNKYLDQTWDGFIIILWMKFRPSTPNILTKINIKKILIWTILVHGRWWRIKCNKMNHV